jgi:Tol biopolymer transport system component
VALGIGEERDGHLRELRYWEERLPAELVCLVEDCLRIVGADVERDVAVAVGRLADAAANTASCFSTVAYGMSPGTFSVFQPKSRRIGQVRPICKEPGVSFRAKLFVGIGGLALAGACAGSSSADGDGLVGGLAYVVASADYGDAPTDIYVTSVDGKERNVTRSGSAWNPAWSPDGRKIAFNSTSGQLDSQIAVINADGTGRRRLTRSARPLGDHSWLGAWSPDGRRIVYQRSVTGNPGALEIYVMNSDGSRKRRLTRNRLDEYGPLWSPNRKRIAFERVTRAGSDIYVVSPDGRSPRRLTRTADNELVGWSPDGRQILFVRSFSGADAGPASGIYVMNSDGTRRRRVLRTDPEEDVRVAGWSSDGELILAYYEGVYVVSVATGRVQQLTRDENDWDATWSPDGQRIAFVRRGSIWVVNRDGTQIHQVTHPQGDARHRSPAWSPR